jgi:hypothetical protein
MTPNIGAVLTHGQTFDPKNWSNNLVNETTLFGAVNTLFDLLERRQIPYLLVGGIALLSYINSRNTQHIDLILSRQDLQKLPEITITDENKNFIRGEFEQLQIDILLTENKLFQQVSKSCLAERQFGNRTIRCVTVEGLILLKLYALPSLYRQGIFDRASLYENDILLLLIDYPLNPTPLVNRLKPHLLESDLDALGQLLEDLQTRVRRRRQTFGSSSE